MSGSDLSPEFREYAKQSAHYAALVADFVKKDVFEGRRENSVEEIVSLVTAFIDISVGLVSHFHKEPVDPTLAMEIDKDVLKYLVGRLGFNVDRMKGSS